MQTPEPDTAPRDREAAPRTGDGEAERSRAQPCYADPRAPAGPGSDPAQLADPEDPTRLADLEYPTARRLTAPCAPPERDYSEVFPAADSTPCPGPPPPPPPPPCPRGPAPCAAVPAVPFCRAVPPPADRYRSTYTAGYADPEAGLRQTAAPRSGRELYGGPAPLPRLAAGTARCRDGVAPAVRSDREPERGPATAAACEESV